MRIKKIELIGFKSFADRTEILLNDGVTCVVGPNGCGKSNISDAIRWVLGERSAKLLRGSRMEDVIFNGTDFRKPQGMAEVSLTVDNSNHEMPIGYDEVVFSRRLYRSGESEYLINRTSCRLKDILDLILDTGMGSNSYSMIEQGRIDLILSADPEERRFLIEEAAGISKYKVKKEEALRKLERTEQNLLRIRDIVTEVRKNIQYAERQAKRAEQYKSKLDRLKSLEIRKALLDGSKLNEQKLNEGGLKQKADQELTSLEAAIEKSHQDQRARNSVLEEILREESSAEAGRYEIKAECQAVTQKREFNRERVQEFRARQIEGEREREKLAREVEHLEKEIQVCYVEREQLKEEHEQAKKVLKDAEAGYESIEQNYRSKREEGEKLKQDLFANATELAELRNALSRIETLGETGEREKKRCREGREKLLREKAEIEARRASYQERAGQIHKQLHHFEEERKVVSRRLEEGRRGIEAVEEKVRERKAKYQELITRLRLLTELKETAEDSERKLLASLSRDGLRGKLVRSLREVVKIEPGYEAAVEAVLGSFAQGLIAEDVETAQGLMVEMGSAHSGPCGIFVQSLVKPNGRSYSPTTISHPLVRRALKEVVEIQHGLECLITPFFENVYVVEPFSPEHLKELLPLAQELKLVTREGILLGPEARIFFRNGRLSSDQGPLHRQAEIETLRTTTHNLQEEIKSLELGKDEKVKQLAQLESVKQMAEDRFRDTQIEREANESLRQGLEGRLAIINEEFRVYEFEVAESEQETLRGRSEIENIHKTLAEATETKERMSEEQRNLGTQLDQLQAERETHIQNLTRLRTQLEGHTDRLRAVEAGERLLKGQMEAIRARRERIAQEDEELSQRVQQIRSEEQDLVVKEQKLEGARQDVEARLSEIRGRKGYEDTQLVEMRKQIAEAEEKIRSLRELSHQKEMALVDLVYQEKTILDRMQQMYHVNLNEVNSQDCLQDPIQLRELEEEIGSLREKVEAFGAVNVLAIEEHDELKKRYDFLAGQESDLNQAREALLEAIRKINRTTKALFAETFTKVQASFQQHFEILFGGGRAELLLLDGENPQESGIDIVVRPPGKKPQHISLLSGGEKALTALALLFALFRVKPSPFCVLDEVDAPLDEANIDRFLAVLRSFLDSTQFLIVTHNRKTIAMGDSLYGVTMEESGVSKMVSVRVVAQDSSVEAKASAAV